MTVEAKAHAVELKLQELTWRQSKDATSAEFGEWVLRWRQVFQCGFVRRWRRADQHHPMAHVRIHGADGIPSWVWQFGPAGDLEDAKRWVEDHMTPHGHG